GGRVGRAGPGCTPASVLVGARRRSDRFPLSSRRTAPAAAVPGAVRDGTFGPRYRDHLPGVGYPTAASRLVCARTRCARANPAGDLRPTGPASAAAPCLALG